jgi:D-alanine-D-alanine ligase
MAQKRIRVGVIFGGRSGEHEVSIRSARGVLSALDPARFEPVLIGIDRAGRWQACDARALLGAPGNDEAVGQGALVPTTVASALAPPSDRSLASQFAVDVFVPLVHGTYGEDGTLQGLLEMAGAAYVGSGVLGSSVGMDKDVSKRLLRDAGLPVVDYLVTRRSTRLKGARPHSEQAEALFEERVEGELGFPCFVKPANMGSSVGVYKVKRRAELAAALDGASQYDHKVLVERGVDAREIEVAVLGNDEPEASVPGEIVPTHEFYSYESKYIDENGASLLVPAPLDPIEAREVQGLAVRAFQALELEGLARIDFFLERGTGRWFVNEVNTLPGFTEISMYPRLWQASGLSYRDLVTRLIELAVERFERRRTLSVERRLPSAT